MIYFFSATALIGVIFFVLIKRSEKEQWGALIVAFVAQILFSIVFPKPDESTALGASVYRFFTELPLVLLYASLLALLYVSKPVSATAKKRYITSFVIALVVLAVCAPIFGFPFLILYAPTLWIMDSVLKVELGAAMLGVGFIFAAINTAAFLLVEKHRLDKPKFIAVWKDRLYSFALSVVFGNIFATLFAAFTWK